MQVSLVMFKADGTRRDFHITGDRFVLGRKNDCDLRIPLGAVSREHCEIQIEDDGSIVLRDLDSSNGTFHNAMRVQETELSAGDEVVIGPVVFTVVVDGEPSELKPVRTMVGGADANGQQEATGGRTPQTQSAPGAGAEEEDEEMDGLPMLDLDEDDDSMPSLDELLEDQPDPSGSGSFPFDDDER
ncbi:MAG: FHA domain-containing protein [Phycisphaeraceae bacterium]